MDLNFGIVKQVSMSMHHIDATNRCPLLPRPIQSCILITRYPNVDVPRLAKTTEMLPVLGRNTLPFQHTRTEPISRESLLQIDTLAIHHLIPLQDLCSHAHPSQVQQLWRLLLLSNEPSHSSKAYTHQRLLLSHRIQLTPPSLRWSPREASPVTD